MSIFRKNNQRITSFEKFILFSFVVFVFTVSSVFYAVKKGYHIEETRANESSIQTKIKEFLFTKKDQELNNYTEGVIGSMEIQILNPLFSNTTVNNYNSADSDIVSLIFSGLLRKTDTGQYLPDLANKMPEISEDKKTYNFKIRENIFWHDGKKFTTEDIKYTIDTIQSFGFLAGEKSSIWTGVETKIISDYKIEFKLPRTEEKFLDNFTQKIVPKHLLENSENGYDLSFHSRPIGTGPYKFFKRDKNNELILTRNANYYLKVPEIKQFTFKFYKDQQELRNAFLEKKINGFGTFKEYENYDFRIGTDYKVFLFLNSLNLKKEIRQSIFHVIANESQDIPEFFYPDYSNDLEKARELLENYGYKKESGIWKKNENENENLNLKLISLDLPQYRKFAEEIIILLNQFGISVDTRYVSSQEFWIVNGPVYKREYDILIYPVSADKIPYYTFFHSNYNYGNNGFNFSRISDRKLDIKIEEFSTGFRINQELQIKIPISEEEKQNIENQIIEQVKQEYIISVLDQKSFHYYTEIEKEKIIMPEKVENFFDRFYYVSDWYVLEKYRIKN